ncbi:MAG: aspartate-semialdehyde dehydrogenase [Candidatus Krumholzibacteria bacterium]|nr:aspartate-semialdehyde dehydrogenase [Candidatus Krumholzibacteria bacterium]
MSEREKKRVAVIGATGVVGQTIAQVLAERGFPVGEYVPVATGDRGERTVNGLGRTWTVCAIEEMDFGGVDICFFSAGAAVSREMIPKALDRGCRVVDNTTAYRMDADVPLVVPEINSSEVTPDTWLVSCPNCAAINLVMTLAPILREVSIERVVVTSLQSVSGAGKEAVAELDAQVRSDLSGEEAKARVFAKPIAFNCLPKIGELGDSGDTVEEQKIIEETRKILGKPSLGIVATAVRVPVRVGHALSVNVELSDELSLEDARGLWQESPGIEFDDRLPTPVDVAGRDTVIVGRLRRDVSRPHAISYWAVGDNLRKGAATNSVQIAELWCSL